MPADPEAMMRPTPLLPANWDVPETFRNRLGTTIGKQRLMEAEGHLLLVVHQPPLPDEKTRRGRLLWRTPAGQWQGSDTGTGPAAVLKHLDEYQAKLEELERAEEAAIVADDYLPLLESLVPLIRAARNLEQVMQDARKTIADDRNLIDFRDRAYELARNFDLLYADAKNGMEIATMKKTEEQTRASQQAALAASRFNLLVAFFFPISVLTGLFGANLRSGFEDVPPPWPLMLLILTGLLCGSLLAIHIQRLSKA